ncbi:hypothetical protein BDZ91DRAFT_334047 [Kalaharituber pfeilii]|nr:hypothetical protein BDZ91DRAFT_334047 [Kalaharituber pfeilii]
MSRPSSCCLILVLLPSCALPVEHILSAPSMSRLHNSSYRHLQTQLISKLLLRLACAHLAVSCRACVLLDAVKRQCSDKVRGFLVLAAIPARRRARSPQLNLTRC